MDDMARIDLGMAILGFLLFVLPLMQIIHRAGYSRTWILAAVVPVANLVLLWVFAFRRWPVERKLEITRRAASPPSVSPQSN